MKGKKGRSSKGYRLRRIPKGELLLIRFTDERSIERKVWYLLWLVISGYL